jgi:hypothetical protein
MMNEGSGGLRLTVPLTLLALAFLLAEGFQCYESYREHGRLAANRETQEANYQEGQRIRKLLEEMVSGTTKLADEGDTNVKAVIDDLRRQGVVFKQTPAEPAPKP